MENFDGEIYTLRSLRSSFQIINGCKYSATYAKNFDKQIEKLRDLEQKKITDVELKKAHQAQIKEMIAEQNEMQRKLLLD